MSTHPKPSDRPATTSPTDLENLGAQLSKVLNRFNELSIEMMPQRRVIDQLVAGGTSGEQHEPLPPGQSEPQPMFLSYTQTAVTSQVINPPEKAFTYPTHGPPPTYAPHIQTNPPHVQIPQNYPPITMSMPFEPQGPHYYSTAEPFTLDTATQGKAEARESSVPVDKNVLKRLDRFEEFIRKSQGLRKQGGQDYNELCLFPDMQLPVGFKVSKFTKYDGTGNPKTHLRMFTNKLGRPIDDENLPVRLFPESLKGDALDWYSNLKPKDMRSWMNLSTAFRLLITWKSMMRAGKIVNVSALKSQLEAMQSQSSSSKKSQFKKKDEEASFIGTVPPKTYPKGFPIGYDPQSFCAYHSRAPGHSTANCWALKHKIQDMIETGDIVLTRKDEQRPSVSNNPLPTHKDTVGAITIEEEIEEPTQYIVDETEIMGVIGEPFILEEEAFEIKENTDPFILEVIPFEYEPSELVVLELPEQAPVLNLQEVPWNYSEPMLLIGGEEIPQQEASAITRSGRIVGEPAVDEPAKAKESATPTRPTVTEEEAFNFLKILKKIEYKVIEKLDKILAQISMLNLLMTSELHRAALLKVLNEAQVPKNIPVDKFTNIVEHVWAYNQISFSDEDLTAEGIGHNKALYISIRCNGKLLPRVLIDNGFALNICLWNTLVKLGV
ncbi:uncharacterized protein [Coffea arabica]|uniref:Retrotransposon gag domain-containing protein n=1 Tax=Coffea arabica TaxID=13443 RepID=A0ABM4UQW9_COFAR